MYIGRFVVLGRNEAGQRLLGYRVSSRSFPDRRIVLSSDRAAVLPTANAAPSSNPYIAYNCLRVQGETIVVANGSHVDPIIDKVSAGYPLLDAVALSLLSLGFEHDAYSTPRICAGWQGQAGYMAIVARDKLMVREIPLRPGQAQLIATYELTDPTEVALEGDTAAALAQALWQARYDHPVAALGALVGEKLSLATHGAE